MEPTHEVDVVRSTRGTASSGGMTWDVTQAGPFQTPEKTSVACITHHQERIGVVVNVVGGRAMRPGVGIPRARFAASPSSGRFSLMPAVWQADSSKH